MENLIKRIESLRNSELSEKISERIKEFEKNLEEKRIFSELCFCILTANSQAERCIRIQKETGSGFEILDKDELAIKLKEAGHRFWSQRAERIVKARKFKQELEENISKKSGREIRSWLVENVEGLGMKESSHFLRNIGCKDLAIVDFHIVDLLVREGLVERPKTITSKKYLEIEAVLTELGSKVNLSLAELDLYLWYLETGKVLK
jgi:N-glycosylase/DNA lyase